MYMDHDFPSNDDDEDEDEDADDEDEEKDVEDEWAPVDEGEDARRW